jgi:hypothetical protein
VTAGATTGGGVGRGRGFGGVNGRGKSGTRASFSVATAGAASGVESTAAGVGVAGTTAASDGLPSPLRSTNTAAKASTAATRGAIFNPAIIATPRSRP